MDQLISSTLFSFIDPPNVKISLPRWVQWLSPMQTFYAVLCTYFIVCGGVIYDVINEPPSIGSYIDERGHQRPQAIMPHRISGQYIMEGLVASFMFCLTAIGMIIADKAHRAPQLSKGNRYVLLGVGIGCMVVGWLVSNAFIRIKMPGYLQ